MDIRVIKSLLSIALCVLSSLFLYGFALQQNATEQGLYFVSLEFRGAQAKVGNNSVKVFITEKRSKTPREKLDLEIVPWMPAHEHGTTALPVVRELGKGQYSVEGLNLSMSGLWEIYVRVNKGKKGEDTAIFNVDVR